MSLFRGIFTGRAIGPNHHPLPPRRVPTPNSKNSIATPTAIGAGCISLADAVSPFEPIAKVLNFPFWALYVISKGFKGLLLDISGY